jgi:hypothetical protein
MKTVYVTKTVSAKIEMADDATDDQIKVAVNDLGADEYGDETILVTDNVGNELVEM